MDEKVRQRALRRLLRITLPDGKVLCYKSATMTFVEALQKIEADKLKEVKLESYHLPLISQEVYPRFKDWMEKPLQGDTSLMSHFEGVIEGVIEGVGKDIKEKLASILCALNEQPGLRTTMLSSKTDIPVKSVERYVKRLKDAGLIKYSGSSKSGGYFLSDSEVRE